MNRDTLFTQSISTYYSQWDFARKLKFLDEFTTNFLQEKRVVTMVISRDDIFLYGKFTGLVGRLLYKLDPATFDIPLADSYYLHRHYWNHPYLLRIIKRIGKLAVLPGIHLSIENFELALNEEVMTMGSDLEIIKVPDISISEVKARLYLHLTIPEKEVDEIITTHLRLEGVQVDPREVAKYIESIDKR